MKFTAVLGLAALVLADMRDPDAHLTASQRWDKFKDEFEKTYTGEEEAHRFDIFKTNLQRIAEHNAKELSYWFGVTPFADLTPEEFKKQTSCKIAVEINDEQDDNRVMRRLEIEEEDLADSVDWVAQGKVTPVKNQGQCGSCWSFSATGAMESRYAIKHGGSPQQLSEQELVDCSSQNHGCNGGSMALAFMFAQQNGGLCSENSIPYKAKQETYMCNSEESGCTKMEAPSGYSSVSRDSEQALMSALNGGPVSIAIEADQRTFQLYKGGVFTGTCGANLDHGVLAVGYGSDGGQDFWKVKNSWGASWGEQGYIRLCRGCGKNWRYGQCGILRQPVYPNY